MWPHEVTLLQPATSLKILYLWHFHTAERSVVFFFSFFLDDYNRKKPCVTHPAGSQSMIMVACPSQLTNVHTIRWCQGAFPAQWKRKQGKGCMCSPIPWVAASLPLLTANEWLQLIPASSSEFVLLVVPVGSVPIFKTMHKCKTQPDP